MRRTPAPPSCPGRPVLWSPPPSWRPPRRPAAVRSAATDRRGCAGDDRPATVLLRARRRATTSATPTGATKAKMAIRNRVLNSIKGTWGGPRTSIGTPMPGNGTIRIATWTFDDWAIAQGPGRGARDRGVSVQVVAAKAANQHRPPGSTSEALRPPALPAGHPEHPRPVSFARRVPRFVPGAGRHRPREVLPLRPGRRPAGRARHLQDLDEPHPLRLQRSVEPGPGDEVG